MLLIYGLNNLKRNNMKLISMTDFVLERLKDEIIGSYNEKIIALATCVVRMENYANFLKKPLELWMFVPCDEEGNVLEEPYNYINFINGVELNENLEKYCEKYQQAKERVLFEGFEYQKQGGEYLVKFDNKPVWVNWNNSKTIEDLIYLKPKLTPTAIKKIGL